MISPTAFELFIKYFDAVDKAVTARLSRKRPWSETALTSLLCDLLDEETQEEHLLQYSLAQLNANLKQFDGLVAMNVRLETHEYPPQVERWVTQSDLGLILQFNDLIIPNDSWNASWLLQAKRLYPTSRDPILYDESSRFGTDSKQHERVKKLVNATGVPFIKYLLYCPRVSALDDLARQKMTHLHHKSLASHIFDYTVGLQIYNDIKQSEGSFNAGMLITEPTNLPRNFGTAHSQLLQGIDPFSWFLARQFAGSRPEVAQPTADSRRPGLSRSEVSSSERPDLGWAHGIVTGESRAIGRAIELFENADLEVGPFLPPHTMTIGVSIGQDLDPERRRLRLG